MRSSAVRSRKSVWLLTSILVCGLIVGCTPPKNYEVIQQAKFVNLTAFIGDEIVSMKKSRDLPNAFGGADIFGGKVDAGYMKLSFLGLTKDGLIIVRRQDVDIQSDATTMSRYGVGTAIHNSNLSGTATTMGGMTTFSGSSTGYTTYIRPRSETTLVLPPNAVEFEWDYRQNNVLDLGKFRITVTNATAMKLDYMIQ